MLPTTQVAIRSILTADPSIAPDERARIMAAIRYGGAKPKAETKPADAPRLMRRAEVARMLGLSTRSVDNLSREGVLKRVCLPNRTRGTGFRESDVRALINADG